MSAIAIDKPKKRSGPRKGMRLGNLPNFPCRWTIAKAASEFQITPDTLSTRLRALNFTAGEDSCYSTLQMATAKYGDLQLERARKVRAEANLAEMDEAENLGRLLRVENVLKRLADGAVTISNMVKSSNLSPKEKMELLTEIADYFDANAKAKLGKLPED